MTYQVNAPAGALPYPMLRRALAAAAVLAAGSVLAPACADNESSLFIRGCQAPEEGTCGYRPDPSGSFFPSGFVDGAFHGAYSCGLLIGNQVVRRGSSDQLRTETSRIELYEAEVRVLDLSGNAVSYADGSAVEYLVPITGFIDPGAGTAPGYGLAQVPMLDAGSLASLGGGPGGSVQVVSTVIVRGRTLGGQELESPEWSFPISVCFGCACQDVIPDLCCADPANDACADLDDPVPVTSCTGSEGYDCRIVGQTCSNFIAANP